MRLREVVWEVASELQEAPVVGSALLLEDIVDYVGPSPTCVSACSFPKISSWPMTQTIRMSKNSFTFFHMWWRKSLSKKFVRDKLPAFIIYTA